MPNQHAAELTDQQLTAATVRAVNTVEQCMREMELAATVLRLLGPDATPERLEAVLKAGLNIELGEKSPYLPGLKSALQLVEMKHKLDMANADSEALSEEDRDRALNCAIRLGQVGSELKKAIRSLERNNA